MKFPSRPFLNGYLTKDKSDLLRREIADMEREWEVDAEMVPRGCTADFVSHDEADAARFLELSEVRRVCDG